jgi:hypothetical protein
LNGTYLHSCFPASSPVTDLAKKKKQRIYPCFCIPS